MSDPDLQPNTSDEDAYGGDPAMPLTEHLSDLRKRLAIACAAIGVVFLAVIYVETQWPQPILSFFRKPLDLRGIPLVFDELTEPFFTTLRVALYTSVFITFPVILGQIWLFVEPALYPQEKKLFWPFLMVSFLLFVGGGLFGYFVVMPFGYDFFLSFQSDVTQPSLRMSNYLSLTVHLLFAFGLVFELPVVSFFLTRLGVIDATFLKENRKYSIVGIFVIAALLTPPDIFTQSLMAGPLIILYEVSILVARFSEPSEQLPAEPEHAAS